MSTGRGFRGREQRHGPLEVKRGIGGNNQIVRISSCGPALHAVANILQFAGALAVEPASASRLASTTPDAGPGPANAAQLESDAPAPHPQVESEQRPSHHVHIQDSGQRSPKISSGHSASNNITGSDGAPEATSQVPTVRATLENTLKKYPQVVLGMPPTGNDRSGISMEDDIRWCTLIDRLLVVPPEPTLEDFKDVTIEVAHLDKDNELPFPIADDHPDVESHRKTAAWAVQCSNKYARLLLLHEAKKKHAERLRLNEQIKELVHALVVVPEHTYRRFNQVLLSVSKGEIDPFLRYTNVEFEKQVKEVLRPEVIDAIYAEKEKLNRKFHTADINSAYDSILRSEALSTVRGWLAFWFVIEYHIDHESWADLSFGKLFPCHSSKVRSNYNPRTTSDLAALG